MATHGGFYTGKLIQKSPQVVHMTNWARQILNSVWSWMALRSAGYYNTRDKSGAVWYLICCLDHTSLFLGALLVALAVSGGAGGEDGAE